MIIIKANDIHNEICLKEVDNTWYEVDDDITYKLFGGKLIVPKGFRTDLASVPKKLQGIIPKRGLYDAGAILHDFLYSKFSTYNINRQDSDLIFYEAMKLCGVDKKTANAFYNAVRIGGEKHFIKCKLNGNVPPERVAIIDKRVSYLRYKDNLDTLLPKYNVFYI